MAPTEELVEKLTQAVNFQTAKPDRIDDSTERAGTVKISRRREASNRQS